MADQPTLDVSQPIVEASTFMVMTLRNSDNPRDKLAQSLKRVKQNMNESCPDRKCDDPSSTWTTAQCPSIRASNAAVRNSQFSKDSSESVTCFATHGTSGVVDLGATKTVIGSNQVQEFLDGIQPEIKSRIQRCKCEITFRFGNHGTLKSQQAMVIPIKGFRSKVAIVPGSTPFLLSNTLLRALGAVIDTEKHELFARRINLTIPLTLTSKGLFLLDLNDLVGLPEYSSESTAETHMTVDSSCKECNCRSQQPAPVPATNDCKGNQTGIKVEQVLNTFSRTEVAAEVRSPERSRSKIVSFADSSSGADSHVTVEASASSPDACGPQEERLLSVLSRGDELHEDSVRKQAPRQELSGSVDSRSSLGPLVHSTLRDFPETRTPDLPGICETQGGEGRAPERVLAVDVQGRSCQAAIDDRTIIQHRAKLCNAQEQESSMSDGLSGGLARRTSWPLGRGRSKPLRADSRTRGCGDSESSGNDESPDAANGASHVPDGECPLENHQLHRGQGCDQQLGSVSECPSLAFIQEAGDVSAECLYSADFTPECHQERKRFWGLVRQYTKELNEYVHDSQDRKTFSPKLTLLEVFCGPNSQLTHQAQQLGCKAHRFGLAQGDLQTVSGRSYLFQLMIFGRPTNLWFSPSCGPWAGFSNLNGSKSVAAWDELQTVRNKHLEQIALGVVLLRYQRQHGRHFHWEQPKRSLMFRLPYLQEVLYYLLAVDVDLCIAGDLKDPISNKPIQKSLTILSTSPDLIQVLTGLRCPGFHDRQVIEGQTKYQGSWINRSTFTEHYPRKFARRIARCLCKLQVKKEAPYRCEHATAYAADHPDATPAKRARVTNPPKMKAVRACPISEVPWGKRIRCTGKTSPIDPSQAWQDIFSRLEKLLPRVGKRTIEDPQILQEVQNMIPNMQVIGIRSCRGSNRTLDPPTNLRRGDAPFRRAVFIERGTGQLRAEAEWENWEILAKCNLIRPSLACKINVTIFAKESPKIPEQSASSQEQSTVQERTSEEASPTQPPRESETPQMAETPPESPCVPEVLEPSKPELSPSQIHDLMDAKQSHRFQSLPKDEQQMIIRAHKNFGHPSPERLSTLLRSQGFRAEVAQAALDLRCSVCQSQTQPKLARPSAIRDELDFNDRICSDMLSWTNKQGTKFHMCHVVDWSTSFQAACVTPDQSTESIIQGISQMWFSWAGVPQEMLVDAGTNYNSEEFSQFAQSCNIKLTTTSIEAPFQNGKAERHGAVLKTMLSKYEAEHPITTYAELKDALWWCVQAKNACSLRKGYAPEVLVLGKHTRVPGAISSDELLPAHLLADSETAQGVLFRKQLACRESARRAFHQADNDTALRRAILRRSRPGQVAYQPGEWVMVWRQGKGALPGFWSGPQKVVVHENAQTIWTTMSSKLFRSAPEHVRPVTASEATQIPMMPNEPSVSVIAQQLPIHSDQGMTRTIAQPNISPQIELPVTIPHHNQSHRPESEQPDNEPEVSSLPNNSHAPSEVHEPIIPTESTVNPDEPVHVPVPTDDDDELVCDNLICLDDDPCMYMAHTDQAYRIEIDIHQKDIDTWKQEEHPEEMAFVASAARRQRAEVKMTDLTPAEKLQFAEAKNSEVNNWIKTGTISKILRDKVPTHQVMRCRWILTWKPIDESHAKEQKFKAKARLVILGYLDPQLDELPRDSPTLGRNAKMLLLQLIASKGWDLRSFDIRAAFLQGKPQPGRTLAIEPVPELAQALQLTTNQICKLEKGAYGLIDAPYLWYVAITDELKNLGFSQSPFDPCMFILRSSVETNDVHGVIGLHVDDGICAGDDVFLQKLDLLEKKYPFGSKKLHQFTFTGIEMTQLPNYSIQMSQSSYVRNIQPIQLSKERREQISEPVTEDERQSLRAIVGSLQYAAVHTRPDLASRLSMLQSSINKATVDNLIFANQTLHEAKKHHDTIIQIQPIRLEDFRFLAFSDASFASKSNPNSHTGMLIMGTHKDISTNTSCPVSPIAWGSKKIQRVVTSTLAAETVSLNTVLDHLSWLRLCWGWMLDPTVNWKQPSEALMKLPETYTTATYNAQTLPECVAATDCKSLFDLVSRTAMPSCSEYRTQLNARAIKDFLAEGVSLRWVHSAAQLADCLTKVMDTSFLRETLKLGYYKLHDELEILKSRATNRTRLKWLRSCDASTQQACNDDCFLCYNFGF